MFDTLMTNELIIRLLSFLVVFVIIALWEVIQPCRTLSCSKVERWTSNLSIVVLNTLALRLLLPGAALGAAAFAASEGWGLFNHFQVTPVLAVLLAVVLLDLAIYLQHVMVHAIPLLWRLHRVHHADLDFDVTTGARFHPIEIVLSMFIKMSVILLIGAPLMAVLIFEVLLNATAMFNHGNVQLPKKLDHILRWFVVTPDMHRVHHSVLVEETDSNFGFNLTWWDRLFGTYRDQPRGGHQMMKIGIDDFRDPRQVIHLGGMLRLPFVDNQNKNDIRPEQFHAS